MQNVKLVKTQKCKNSQNTKMWNSSKLKHVKQLGHKNVKTLNVKMPLTQKCDNGQNPKVWKQSKGKNMKLIITQK